MKVICIDPFACTIEHIEIGEELTDYYKALSHETMPVTCFEAVRVEWLRGGDTLFVDEEGLFKEAERFFTMFGVTQALAGKGLIIGADNEGDAIDADTSVELVRKSVRFYERFDGQNVRQTVLPWVRTATTH